MKFSSKFSTIWRHANKVRKGHNKSLFHQAQEIFLLYSGPGSLSPSEYYEYGLYDDQHFSESGKKQFLGYRCQKVYEKLNVRSWHSTANDKLLFEAVMEGMGLATPKIFGVFHPLGRHVQGAAPLRNITDLKTFLANHQNYPLFVKPIHGYFGKGTFLIRQYYASDQTILTQNGRMPLESLIKGLQPFGNTGWLIQQYLLPSTRIQAICGNRLSTVRLLVLQTQSGPLLFRANWKIPIGDNIVDNTDGWTNGNIVAAVDHHNGKVQRAYQGRNGELHLTDRHPDTNISLQGLTVPDWDSIKDYVLFAARGFPGIGFQGWDIASTSQGIMALEVNLVTHSTVEATQRVSGQGFLDNMLAEALDQVV